MSKENIDEFPIEFPIVDPIEEVHDNLKHNLNGGVTQEEGDDNWLAISNNLIGEESEATLKCIQCNRDINPSYDPGCNINEQLCSDHWRDYEIQFQEFCKESANRAQTQYPSQEPLNLRQTIDVFTKAVAPDDSILNIEMTDKDDNLDFSVIKNSECVDAIGDLEPPPFSTLTAALKDWEKVAHIDKIYDGPKSVEDIARFLRDIRSSDKMRFLDY